MRALRVDLNIAPSSTEVKNAKRYRDEGINLVLIDRDLRELFPDSAAVNKALRAYMAQRKRSELK